MPKAIVSVGAALVYRLSDALRGTITGLKRRTDAAAAKQADSLRPVLTECEDYERRADVEEWTWPANPLRPEDA